MQKFLFYNDFSHRLTRHLFFILVITFFFSLLLYVRGTHSSFPEAWKVTAINSIFFLGYAYLTLFLLIPFALLQGKVLRFLLMFIAAGIIFSVIKLIISDELFYSSVSPEFFAGASPEKVGKLLLNAKDMTFFVALLCVVKFTKDYTYTERQLLELEKQNREAQQRLLQSQLNPHFLFNTINNLYALSLLEPGKTFAVTKKIQKVLSYIVEQSRSNFINLNEELNLVQNYISLEKLRYGKRLRTRILKKGNIKEWLVPPMILFVMAENGICHGSQAETGNSWLHIVVDAQPDFLVLETTNSKPNVNSVQKIEKGKGNGLQNLKKRLDILYTGNNYKLEIDENEHLYCIRLHLSKPRNGIDKNLYR